MAIHGVFRRLCRVGRGVKPLDRQAFRGPPKLRGPDLRRVAAALQRTQERVVARQSAAREQQHFVAACAVHPHAEDRHLLRRRSGAPVGDGHREHSHRARFGGDRAAQDAATAGRHDQTRSRGCDTDGSPNAHDCTFQTGPGASLWSRWNQARRSLSTGNSERWMSDVQARRPSVRSLPVVPRAIALTP